ncbi:MAG: hypothetical protein JWN44_3192 [Myxococcales bacterium]|nr:hypothetical protein [Myxococcales bacterium]
MRTLRLCIVLTIGIAFLGLDVGETVRSGSISDGSAHAKKHRRHHRKHARKHRKHHKAPATEM